MKRAADHFRNACGVVDLGDPLGQFAEHAAVIDLLECFAFGHIAPNLPDEQDQRRGVLVRGVYAHRGVGRPRSAGDEGDARLSSHLAPGIGHVGDTAFLPAND